MVNRLRAYNDEPFDSSTEVGLNDIFTGDGTTDTFTLSEKTNLEMGATVQANLVQYYLYNYGYVKDGTYDFITSSAPADESIIVAPALITLHASAYDQTDINEDPESNIVEVAFYLGNPDDIATKQFEPADGLDGIGLLFVDQVGYGAEVSMLELACATQDEAGTAMTYNPSGEELFTAPITAFSIVCADVAASADTVITLEDASEFILGDYLVINKGGGTEEITKLVAVSGNDITVTATNYDHDIGETVYACARKFWFRYTVPVDFTENTAVNYYNIGLRVRGRCVSRV